MRYGLIATDLDGTLLGEDGLVSGRSRAAIQAAQAAGLTVAFVTARPPRDIRDLAEQAGLTGLAICSNGAIVYDIARGEMLHHLQLGSQLGRDLVVELRERVPGIAFAIEHGHKMGVEPGFPPLFDIAVHDHAPRVDCALQLCDEQPTKLIAWREGHSADDLHALMVPVVGGRGEVTHSGWPIVEVGPVGVSKASGLAWLAAHLGLRADQVMAFGDMPNDVPMLVWAGRGIGVANAHPEVLAVAREVAPSNAEDGVAQVIEALLAAA